MTEQELREQHIQRTIQLSKQAFYEGLEAEDRGWLQFLREQLCFIRKRWWFFQLLLLVLLWLAMYFGGGQPAFWRQTAVAMPMFGLLMIPELWKNVHNGSMEVENSACFTLRQIYAARLTLFALADLLLLTVFFAAAVLTVHLTLFDIITHFLIPLNITACVCLGTLCAGRFRSEYVAVGFCVIWAGVWYRIVSDGRLYLAVSKPLWAGLLLLTLFGLALLGKQLLKTGQNHWEEGLLWN